MSKFHELCIQNKTGEVLELAEELGWNRDSLELNTVFIEADDWGDLKQQINEKRSDADVLVFEGGDEELNRKAAETPEIDILLHPEKGRKDSGMNHVVAELAAENSVAIGFDLKQLKGSKKNRTHILRHWKHNLKLCKKYDTPYIITTNAEKRYDLRAPRELAALIKSISGAQKAVTDYPETILERAEKKRDPEHVRPGVEEVNDE